MKTGLYFLRGALALLVMAGCGATWSARADFSLSVNSDLWCEHEPSYGEPGYGQAWGNNDYYGAAVTNATFGVTKSAKWVQFWNGGNTGAWGYYDFERTYDGVNVNHVMRIAYNVIDAPYASSGADYSLAGGGTELDLTEDMIMVWFPSSSTDTPPTEVSFQISYSLQGQFNYQYAYTNTTVVQAGPGPSPGIGFSGYAGGDGGSKAEYGVSGPISYQILSQRFSEPLNNAFTVELSLADGGVYWANEYPDLNASTLDVNYTLNGFVNLRDQNNQPISGTVLFYYVNPNDTTQRIAIPNPANLTGPQTISLQTIPGTNNLVIQWPSYATNYQLQTTTNLVNASWTTNSLPTPVPSGLFQQVTVPTTNGCAFFRLLQTN